MALAEPGAELYRAWRAVADGYEEPRALVGEVWLDDPERFARYLRPDEMHNAFNFDFMTQPWDAARLRASIAATLDSHRAVDALPTWALSNHDLTRPATRYGRADSSFSFGAKRFGVEHDPALGLARARSAALLAAALPGSLYVYQGDELGLGEVENLPLDALQDPMHFRSGGTDPGRDGCRVPLPWTREGASLGFAPDAASARPWLPQPAEWSELSVEAQSGEPGSTLELYRAMLALRRREPGFAGGFDWIDHPDPAVIAFRRDDLLCVVNTGDAPARLPEHTETLLVSAPLNGDALPGNAALPGNTAAWLRR